MDIVEEPIDSDCEQTDCELSKTMYLYVCIQCCFNISIVQFFCVHYLFDRIDYEAKLQSYIDWNIKFKWPFKESPTTVRNKLFRICNGNENHSNQVFEYIMKNAQLKSDQEADLCKHVLYNDKYDKLFHNVSPNVISIGTKFEWCIDPYMDETTESKWEGTVKVNNYQYRNEIKNIGSYVKSFSFPHLQRDKLQSLYNVCVTHGLVGRLIYACEHLSIDLLRDVLVYLDCIGIKDNGKLRLSKIYLSMDRMVVDQVLNTLGLYCSIGDLLRLSRCNRAWYATIGSLNFTKQCTTFQKLRINEENAEEWSEFESGFWFFGDIKMLTITAHKNTLHESDLPPIDATNVQYLHTSTNYLSKHPQNLKALQISGSDKQLTNDDIEAWRYFDNPDAPLKLTVISWDSDSRFEDIPNSEGVLWVSCRVRNSIVSDCMKKPHVTWIGLQNCISTLPSSYIKPEDDEKKLNEYTPKVSFNLLYSDTWTDFWMLLHSDATYEKRVLKVNVVVPLEEVNLEALTLFSFLAYPKNKSTPKSITMLFQVDDKVTEAATDFYEERIAILFNWCNENVSKVFYEEGIAQFVLGIINTYAGSKHGDTFDLKKYHTNAQIDKHNTKWDDIVLTQKVVNSPANWEMYFHKIINQMPK